MQTTPMNAPKRATTVRLAMWSAQHRWLVFGLWFATIATLTGIGIFGLGIKNLDNNDPGTARSESARANAILHANGAADTDRLQIVISNPGLKVSDPAYQAVVQQIASQLRAVNYNDNGVSKPTFAQVLDYYSTHDPSMASPDGTTTQIIAPIVGTADTASAKYQPVKPVISSIKQQHKDFTIYAFSNVSINEDINNTIGQDMQGAFSITLPITFIILLLAFGALIAALVPLVLALTSLAAAFSVLAIWSNVVGAVDNSTGDLVVLIGLAVGIDYSLFLITRYRSERRRGRDKLAAIEVASSTAGRAVFFSGLTVMISLSGLLFINETFFTGMVVGTIAVVLAALIGSLTFLPATLAILGNGINWGRIPYFGRDRDEGSGFWSRIIGTVMRRPAMFAASVLVLLLLVASPVLHMSQGLTGMTIYSLPAKLELRQAVELMQAKWPQGTSLSLDVVISADSLDRPALKDAVSKFNTAALQLPGLSGPAKTTVAPSGKAEKLSFTMSGTAHDQANHDLVAQVRTSLIPAYFKGIPQTEALVTGSSAEEMDIVKVYTDVLPTIFAFVLGLSFLLLLLAFRSIVIPIKAILLNLLSTSAAYGAVVLVFQDGWLSDQLGFKPLPYIESWMPIFLFTILFGLSMDYHLFVLTRIKEERDRGLSTRAAVAKGISITSGTITSAAAIMVVVFTVFVGVQMLVIRQLGLGLAIAILVDATLIRCVLLPATMELLGEWNWWLPRFLDWLPHVSIEGEFAPATPTAAPFAEPIAATTTLPTLAAATADAEEQERELVEV